MNKKIEAYELMLLQLKGLLEAESNWIANLANSSALLNETLEDTVFAGYYLFEEGELILGPFQGRVSCTRITMGKGVCGESAAAMSEIVVPMIADDQLIGVLDIDSGKTNSYDEIDQKYLEEFAAILVASRK
mgnify:CR=1 FL=1